MPDQQKPHPGFGKRMACEGMGEDEKADHGLRLQSCGFDTCMITEVVPASASRPYQRDMTTHHRVIPPNPRLRSVPDTFRAAGNLTVRRTA